MERHIRFRIPSLSEDLLAGEAIGVSEQCSLSRRLGHDMVSKMPYDRSVLHRDVLHRDSWNIGFRSDSESVAFTMLPDSIDT